MKTKKMQLSIVESKEDGIFVSDYWKSSYSCHDGMSRLIIDGKNPLPTFHKCWWKVEKIPKKIEKIENQPDINYRYVLRDSSFESKQVPAVIPREEAAEWDSDDYGWRWKEQYSKLESLYERKSDPQPDVIKEVPFEIVAHVKVERIINPDIFSYKTYDGGQFSSLETTTQEDSVHYQLMDRIVFPGFALPTKQCKLSSKKSYAIIRAFIKDKINPKWAEITSDYDFCFTVKKKIQLHEPIEYQVDVASLRARKPRYKTKLQTHRDVVVFEMTHAERKYKGYPILPGFEGKDLEDLKRNIDEYCNELIARINEPFVDCPKCKGTGVLLSSEEKGRKGA